ncbi:alpha/beta hydrolase [Novosphingobium clariflavum]|mgnify:CR=1 FL=1|uniref:Alpha/beta hydrolase n=1 Tax=Novosphingobium clariflavum TaxID=2029884 RepID=A0ABV6S498_9SPHN|nr:alpha/beta hydrolase [Novosphingobium clariflavum]
MMRRSASALALAALALCGTPARAQPAVSRETIAAPLQPGAIDLPVAKGTPQREVWHLDGTQVAVRNVTRPTLTPVLPVGRGTGAAMIVAPGGGFLGLAIEKEGWDVARWLAGHGIAAFVLKYRVLPTPADQAVFAGEMASVVRGGKASFAPPADTPDPALEDARAALALLHQRAAQFAIDPDRIGMMGFSAGGMLTRSLATRPAGYMPAFIAPIYPMMNAVPVPANAPPMFVALASDDPLFGKSPFGLVDSWRAAGKPVEFHYYTTGGHGFGLGKPGTPSEGWMDQLYRWLSSSGFLTGEK